MNALSDISITTTLWEVTVEAIGQITDISRRKSHHVHLRLLNTLKALREFYYCDGAGVNGNALDTEAYFVRCQYNYGLIISILSLSPLSLLHTLIHTCPLGIRTVSYIQIRHTCNDDRPANPSLLL